MNSPSTGFNIIRELRYMCTPRADRAECVWNKHTHTHTQSEQPKTAAFPLTTKK